VLSLIPGHHCRCTGIGLEQEAEHIYRQILSENPNHSYALHLLGTVFYQRGESELAIDYMERAISSGAKPRRGLHASLGECYRKVGRADDAIAQFKCELALYPNDSLASYSLAVTYQQLFAWDEAVALYRSILEAKDADGNEEIRFVGHVYEL
jgi:tetratricopeptide (TPR) repeat protein